MNVDGMPLAHRQRQFISILGERPNGFSSADIAATVGLSLHRTQYILSGLHKAGSITMIRSGNSVAWSTAEHAARIQRVAAGKSRAKALARKRRDREAAAFRKFMQVKRRVVPAGRFPPPECIAANSVFNLAQRA